jgi:hypothetical protein
MKRLSSLARATMSVVLVWVAACGYTPSSSRGEGAPQAASVPTFAPSTPLAPTGGASFEPSAGAWRLSRWEELSKVTLWLSHILIRHNEVSDANVSFQFVDWHWPGPAPTRNRDAALQLARQIRERAARAPERFGEMVREFSEDPATRDVDGYLGGITADQLTHYVPQVLDTLQDARIGDITPVVETRWGFHVLLWNPPPPEEMVSGARIVIGHDQAPWLRESYSGRGTLPWRARPEALALATRVYEQARREPAQFDRLVQTYSEHFDASRRGDFGTYSTREPAPFPREVAALRRLAPGEIAAPLDSLYGFQILRRTDNRERVVYRMAAIRLMFDVTAPDGAPASASLVLEQIRAMYAEIDRDPARFDSLRTEHCCTKVSDVVAGRNPEMLVALLARMEPGEIAREPLRFGPAYMIPKLLDRSVHTPAASARLALPSLDDVDLQHWLPQFDVGALGERLRLVGEQARALPPLNESTAEQLLREHVALAADLPGIASVARAERVEALNARAQALLAAADYTRYRQLLIQQLATLAEW